MMRAFDEHQCVLLGADIEQEEANVMERAYCRYHVASTRCQRGEDDQSETMPAFRRGTINDIRKA